MTKNNKIIRAKGVIFFKTFSKKKDLLEENIVLFENTLTTKNPKSVILKSEEIPDSVDYVKEEIANKHVDGTTV